MHVLITLCVVKLSTGPGHTTGDQGMSRVAPDLGKYQGSSEVLQGNEAPILGGNQAEFE